MASNFWGSEIGFNLSLEKKLDLMLTEFTILPTGKWCLVFLVEVPKLSLNLVDPKV